MSRLEDTINVWLPFLTWWWTEGWRVVPKKEVQVLNGGGVGNRATRRAMRRLVGSVSGNPQLTVFQAHLTAELVRWVSDEPSGQSYASLIGKGRRPNLIEAQGFAEEFLGELADRLPPRDDWATDVAVLCLVNRMFRSRARRDNNSLLDYINGSTTSLVYWDALLLFCDRLVEDNADIPSVLHHWRLGVEKGSRPRPPERPGPPHRTGTWSHLALRFRVILAVEMLGSLRMPPVGKVSGCAAVAGALGWKEPSVKRIWYTRIGELGFRQVAETTIKRIGVLE